MKIDLTMDEILDDLCAPGLPPGRWNVDERDEPRSAAILPEARHSTMMASDPYSPQEENQCQGLRRKSSSTTPRC
jgi:hypothetical protein